MIFIRVPGNYKPYVNPRLFHLGGQGEPHPLAAEICVPCSEPLGVREPVVLVPVGIAPEDRKETGWTNAAAVAVHLSCAGYSEDEIEHLGEERRNA